MITDFIKARKPKLGTGKRFAQLEGKLSKKGVDDPKALAAYIGRKKFGKKKFGKLSAHKKSLFGMARFNKAVVAGTRPFAQRALPKEQVKQVRAKAPRYGVMKSVSAPCDNCGQRPAQDSVPLCVGCASWMEKARKRKPDMVDHIMRMESGDASDDEGRHAMQQMVNSGQAWKMQGSYGRAAMDMINSGHIALGHQGHRDYYGNYVPSRHEVQEGTKGHASFVRAAGNEPDKCGKDCPTPEVPDQLPPSIRSKKINKAVFPVFPLGPLAKTYVRVDAARAEGFLKGDGRGYPQSQCPACGKHGNALEVMQHMQSSGHVDDDKGANAHTKIGRAVPELDGHIGMGTLKSMRKGFEFKVLDENDPEYHGHTGGGAGYAGKKWVHMHGNTTNAGQIDADTGHFDHDLNAYGPKEEHRHYKMGAWTTHHSPSGYRDDILGETGKNEADSSCALPNCGHPESRHSYADDGRPACMDCNNNRPRRNVRHGFRSTPDLRSA